MSAPMPAPVSGVEIELEPFSPALSSQSTLLAQPPLLIQPWPRQPCRATLFCLTPLPHLCPWWSQEPLTAPVSPGSINRQRWEQAVFGHLARSTLCCSFLLSMVLLTGSAFVYDSASTSILIHSLVMLGWKTWAPNKEFTALAVQRRDAFLLEMWQWEGMKHSGGTGPDGGKEGKCARCVCVAPISEVVKGSWTFYTLVCMAPFPTFCSLVLPPQG